MKTHVVKTTPDAPLSEAIDLMDLYQANGLPVVDATGRLCGMLMEGDVVRAVRAAMETATAFEQGRSVAERTVGEVMTPQPLFVLETAELQEAAALMWERNLKRVPVVTAEGQLIGTLNRVDIVQAIFEEIL